MSCETSPGFEPAPRERCAGAPRSRVLLCDDSAAMRVLVRDALGPEYDVREAETGEDAIRLARASPPDVVLCDLVLPGVWGDAVLAAFRATPELARIPFVLLTVRGDQESRAAGLEAGADDYLGKPLVVRELRARVASLVRARRAAAELEARSEALERVTRRVLARESALLQKERLHTLGTLAAGVAQAVNDPLACAKAGASALDGLLDAVDRASRAKTPAAPAFAPALGEARALSYEISGGLRRIERIAGDLRSVAIGPGAYEPVAPEEALRLAWDAARERGHRSAQLVVRGAETPAIETSRPLLVQALIAVLEHALQSAPSDAAIEVAIADRAGGVELEVGSSAVGGARHAFERTGLGLTVAHAVLRGLGGELGFADAGGRGHQLVAWLPRKRERGDA